MPEPPALERMKRRADEEVRNMRLQTYILFQHIFPDPPFILTPPPAQARLIRSANDALVLKGVTMWHEAAETRPGANAKSESVALEL